MIPLELWDLWVGDRILWDCMEDPEFHTLLFQALLELHAGRGATRSGGPVPACIAGFEELYLTGGRSKGMAIIEVLVEGPWRLYRETSPEKGGSDAGLAMLLARGLNGWVVDVGQSALKISGDDLPKRWARDFDRLPLRPAVPEDEAGQREALRAFISEALLYYQARCRVQPTGLVFALPSRLDDDGVPEGSSYIGMAGDAMLVPDVLRRAGLEHLPTLVLNDAEMAAFEASRGLPRPKTLVLTLGFGVGAALVEKPPR